MSHVRMMRVLCSVLKVFNEQFELFSKHQEEIKQVFPKEG
jgi:glycerol kinase